MNSILDLNNINSKVCVIIPSYNHKDYIGSAIESVMAQKYKDFKLVVIDDCSNDESVAVILEAKKCHDFLFIQNENNEGISNNLNLIISNVASEFIALLGSDDLMLPDRLEKQVNCLQSNANYAGCASNVYRIDREGKLYSQQRIDKDRKLNLVDFTKKRFYFPAPSALYRRQTLIEVGMFDNKMRIEDWDLWIRICSHKYTLIFMSEILTMYRIHDGNFSKKIIPMYEAVLEILTKHRAHLNYFYLIIYYFISYAAKAIKLREPKKVFKLVSLAAKALVRR